MNILGSIIIGVVLAIVAALLITVVFGSNGISPEEKHELEHIDKPANEQPLDN